MNFSQLATKIDLAELEVRITRWMVGGFLAMVTLQAGILIKIL